MSNYIPPIDFGIRGMAAALEITESEFRKMFERGEVSAPDCVRQKEPRWSALGLGAEIKKRLPTGCEPVLYALQALLRAERAEGYHDDDK